jgi:hypothetical protein
MKNKLSKKAMSTSTLFSKQFIGNKKIAIFSWLCQKMMRLMSRIMISVLGGSRISIGQKGVNIWSFGHSLGTKSNQAPKSARQT